jgi:hypothetical protein
MEVAPELWLAVGLIPTALSNCLSVAILVRLVARGGRADD